MFAFVGKKNLTESVVSECPDKNPTVTALGIKKTSYDAVYDAEKRRRQSVSGWKDQFLWLELCVEEMRTDGNVHAHFMKCKVCCKHPLYADNQSPFFVGSPSFRIDPIN